MRLSLLICLLISVVSCSQPEPQTPQASAPAAPAADDWDKGAMATAANPYAVAAASEMLRQGGHAVDAAIAAHAVLGLVEPQSSGLGGGGFMLVYQREDRSVTYLDGRETAPSAASADMFMKDGEAMGFLEAWQSGRSVGVPGAVAMYKLAHDKYGNLPWAEVFGPAIRLASEGFNVPGRMANNLPRMQQISRLDENPGAAEYFYPGGVALQEGQLVTNPEYADTLRRIAAEGPDAFYHGEIAAAIAAAAQAEPNGGSLTVEDIGNYRAVERDAVCGPFREMLICSAAPPSSGAMQIMVPQLYDYLASESGDLADRVTAFVDAQRLAYADRDYYFGDPDVIDVPVDALLNSEYLKYRADNPTAPDGDPEHGDPSPFLDMASLEWSSDTTQEPAGTSHLSIVDGAGNAVSLTASVESAFGSARWAHGFVLNNEMTDFARQVPVEGPLPANAVSPSARPRSSMSPTIVLDSENDLLLVTGSPGGNSIPAYTAKTILGILDWGMTVKEAVDFPNIIARGRSIRVETGMETGQAMADALRSRGYNVQESDGENSGLHVILVREDGLEGAADPRREGIVETTP